MNSVQICSALNRIIALHEGSLPLYISDAAPWFGADTSAKEALAAVASNQRTTIERLGRIVLEHGEDVRHGSYPTEFTGFHDLSLDFLRDEMLRRQTVEISQIESIAASLPESAEKSAAEEALGAARGNLESLREISATPTML